MNPNFLITSSWDDGSKHDLKLAELLLKYNIPGTFYIAHKGIRGDILYPQNIKKLSKNFEIGSHTLKHLNLTQIPIARAEREIIEGKIALEDLIGKEVTSFCYPWGAYNSRIKQLVGLNGFSYARTTKAFATRVLDRLAAPITIHAYDDDIFHHIVHRHKILLRKLLYYSLLKKGLNFKWDDLAILFIDYCRERGGIFHLWGHSWEIDKKNDWARLERVLKYISDKTTRSQRFTNRGLTQKMDEVKKKFYCNLDPKQFEEEYLTFYYSKELRVIKDMVSGFDKNGVKVLDVGCGTGRISSLFGRADYTGVDYSRGFIDFARKKYGAINKKFINSEFNNNNEICSSKFDLIILWGFIDRQTDPLKVIKNLLPMVKRGTRIVFTIHNGRNPFFNAIKNIRNEYFIQPYSITSFDYNTLKPYVDRFCKSNGFSHQVSSLGLINPAHKYIPYIQCGNYGNTLVYILDKA